MLRGLGLEGALGRVGGLPVAPGRVAAVSIPERQRVAVAPVWVAAPAFAGLRVPGAILVAEEDEELLARLGAAALPSVALGKADARPAAYEAVLGLRADGDRTWRPLVAREGSA